ncbi:MAG: N-6 DNA methylase [Planctomycetes bacterium]|nr:N-6 DNA methylase [Planctomycetota bacterium]
MSFGMDVVTLPVKTQTRRRELGSYYTPRFIVQRMLCDNLQPLFDERSCRETQPIRILDPACGDGAFLLEAFDLLKQQYAACAAASSVSALQIVKQHLFGVDIDYVAVEKLHRLLLKRINPSRPHVKTAQQVLSANIHCSDALSGADFSANDVQTPDRAALNWKATFPNIAAEGGFDLIIGNPPYRRELDAKELFEQLAATPFGRKWRQARMDYWYYFLHRGLDLLKDNGRLSFIVNSYWTASTGAEKLIRRLEQETTLEEILLLGNTPIFADVSGRHLVMRLQKGKKHTACRVIDLSSNNSPSTTPDGPATISRRLFEAIETDSTLLENSYQIPQQELFQNGRLSLSRPDAILSQLKSTATLGELFEVRQGMAENPPCINRRHLGEFQDRYQIGEGVFVLTPEEVESLNLSEKERSLLRPYYKSQAVGRYRFPNEPKHSVLYLTKETAPSLEGLPLIKRHLHRFRPLLERRRETKNGLLPWWCLHWPREERIFTEPKILCAQMGKQPQFVQIDRPAFVGFSINLILQASAESFSLKTLTAILNSELAKRWFSRNAKRRGVNLEINGNHLRVFPLPNRNDQLEREIEALVIGRQQMESTNAEPIDAEQTHAIDQILDQRVYRMYGVDTE